MDWNPLKGEPRECPQWPQRLTDALRIDPRSLGLFRISLAVTLLCQLVQRGKSWWELNGPNGIIRSESLSMSHEIPYFPTLLSSWEQARFGIPGFFVFAIVVYALLLIGWKTRWMSVLSLFVFSTLMHRNPYLMIGADAVLGSMLLWSVLLPLGDRFSIDEIRFARAPSPRIAQHSICRIAEAGALLQIVAIYLAAAWLKSGPTWWKEGTALTRVLGMTAFQNPLAGWMSTLSPGWLAFLTRAALGVEYAIPVLILLPWGRPWTRRAAILLIFSLHLAIVGVLDAGLFPVVMFALTPLLLTGEDWESIRVWRSQSARLIRTPTAAGTSLRIAGEGAKRDRFSWRRLCLELIAVFFLCGFLLDNFNRNVAPAQALRVDWLMLPWRMAAAPQRWEMFAPDPPEVDVVITAELQTIGGETIRLWSNDRSEESANRRETFLWKVMTSRLVVPQEGLRKQEGETVRRQMCEFFLRDAVRRGILPANEPAIVEIWVKLNPTNSQDPEAWDRLPICVARHGGMPTIANSEPLSESRR